VELGYGLAGRAAKSGRLTFEGPNGLVQFSDSNQGLIRAIAIPPIVGARVVGAVEARHDEVQVVTLQAVEVLRCSPRTLPPHRTALRRGRDGGHHRIFRCTSRKRAAGIA
jgi:hypothetical protein